MTNIYFAWFHLRLYSRPTTIGVNQELHFRVAPVSAGAKTTAYLTLQDPKPLQEAWQCPTCLPQHWQEEIPCFSLGCVWLWWFIHWRESYADSSSGASIEWRLGMPAYTANRCLYDNGGERTKFRKECLRPKKAWLNALGLAFLIFLFGIVQYRKSCDKNHGGRCQFTRNTKPRFASFISIFLIPPAEHACSAACISKTHQARRQYFGPRHGSIKAITWPWNQTAHWCRSPCMTTYCACELCHVFWDLEIQPSKTRVLKAHREVT